VRIENDVLACTVLADKGADLYELIYKPKATDVLWKSPWGLKAAGNASVSGFDSQVAWMEHYAGGSQVLFPNGGSACNYKGTELSFHGEASMIPWRYEVSQQGESAAELRLHARLFRSPFRIHRTMRVEQGKPVLLIKERVTNEAGEPMQFMWSHHPAYGAPFLSEQCVISTNAKTVEVDDEYIGYNNPLPLNTQHAWPNVAGTDLSCVPGQSASRSAPRDTLAYLQDFGSGEDPAWYAITNTHMGFGVGVVWPKEIFPYAWFWQELHSSAGYPWYKGVYVMAIEPASTIPGHGLVSALQRGARVLSLGAGESSEIEFRIMFYQARGHIQSIAADGAVSV
jgi:galactose mutarotase-like enzyme